LGIRYWVLGAGSKRGEVYGMGDVHGWKHDDDTMLDDQYFFLIIFSGDFSLLDGFRQDDKSGRKSKSNKSIFRNENPKIP